MEIHKKNYAYQDLHSGNIFSHSHFHSKIGDLGLCQQITDEKDEPNKIYGVVPYLAPEILSYKQFTKESDIYSFGDIINGKRPKVTDDTPELYAELMKKCWDHDPENKPTSEEIEECFRGYHYDMSKYKKEIIKSAETNQKKL